MADNILSQQQQEDLLKLLEVFGTSSKLSASDLKGVDNFKKLLSEVDKTLLTNKKTLGGLTQQWISGRRLYKDLATEIEALDDKIEELSELDTEEARIQADILKQRRVEMAKQHQYNTQLEALTSGAAKFAGSIATIGARAAGNFAKGLQNNADAFELAGGLMEAGVDAANAGVQTASSAGQMIGESMMHGTGKTKAFGTALMVGSMAVGKLGDAAAAASKFAIQYLVKETQKMVEAFNKTSASGAMFANGMTGMQQAAAKSGLTVKQFSEVVSRNSENFAQSGLGVTEGAKMMGNVTESMKKSGIQTQLLKLGYGFEEQGDMVAATMRNMRKYAGNKVTTEQIATTTSQYAENLRVLQAITGEDMKRKEEEVRTQNNILAFQQKVATMSPEQQAQINLAMASMSEVEKQNYREMVVFKTVINKQGALYLSMTDGAREKLDAQVALTEKGKFTAQENAKLNAEYGKRAKESALNNKAAAQAAYAGHGDIAGAMQGQVDAIDQANKYTGEAVDGAKKDVQGQKNANDQLTSNIVSASQAAQKMAVDLESQVMKPMGQFAKVTHALLSNIQKELSTLGDGKGESGQGFLDKVVGFFKRGVHWVEDLIGIGDKSKANEAPPGTPGGDKDTKAQAGGPLVTAPVTPAVIPIISTDGKITDPKTLLEGGTGNRASSAQPEPKKYANGGIANGPISGFPAIIEGTKAVVPLPSGEEIPVKLIGSSSSSNSGSDSGLDELIRLLQKHSANQDKIIKYMDDHSNLTKQLLNVSS